MIKMNTKELDRKLKRERFEECLNCEKLVKCGHIDEFEECIDFIEVEGEVWNVC